MNNIGKFILLGIIFSALTVNAAEQTGSEPVQMKAVENVANMDMVVKDNFIKAKYASAENRFIQSNVKASYDDFSDLIQHATHDDYVLLLYGIKMAEFGFFSLSNDLIARLDNNFFTASYVKDMRKFYYPSGIVNPKDELYLSDAYSNIVYNNMSLETTSELINSNIAEESDYTEELPSLGLTNGQKHEVRFIYDDGSDEIMNIPDGTLLPESALPAYDESKYTGWIYERERVPYSPHIPIYEDVTFILEQKD